jgi:hypothetical protein
VQLTVEDISSLRKEAASRSQCVFPSHTGQPTWTPDCKVYGYQHLIVNSPSALGLGMIYYCMELAEVQNVPKHAFPINFQRMQNNFVFLKRVKFGSDKQMSGG